MDTQFKNFILRQDDSKKFDTNQDFWCKSWDDKEFIGDPMIQFAMEIYPNATEIEAIYKTINIWLPNRENRLVYCTDSEEFIKFCEKGNISNYKEAKKFFEL